MGCVAENNDREYFISQGRQAVRLAFGHARRDEESPIAYFDGSYRPKAPKRTATRPRTQVMHAVATRPSGYSRPALIDRQPITGHIHRAIAELDPLQFLWVQYRYRPPGSARMAHGEHFRRDYFRRYEAEHLQGCKTGTRRIVRNIIAVAMVKGRAFTTPQSAMAYAPDMSQAAWNKTYRPHWLRVCSDLANIDADALYEVGIKTPSSGCIA